MSAPSLTTAQSQFEAALPAITSTARYAFRRRPHQDRAEAVAEAQACAWKAWRGLVERGKDPTAVGVSGIAGYAVRHVINGRRIGNKGGGRGAMDVYHRKAQAAFGFKVVSLDSEAEVPAEPSFRGVWVEWFAGDNRVTPADEACFRLDFTAWLESLPVRKRRVAELLAEGWSTGEVARELGVTPGAISQARTSLAANWRRYQADAPTDRTGLAIATA